MHTTAWIRLSVQLQGAEHTAHSAEFTFSLWHPGVEIYIHTSENRSRVPG